MKYNIWDNDNGIMLCATDSKKEAFTAVLNHLIAAKGSEVDDPIMWPVVNLTEPENQMPDMRAIRQDAWNLIRQAQEAYKRITEFIPKSVGGR